MNTEKIKIFQKKIRAWYKRPRISMPWRMTNDPWHIFVSEVMLQQTQIPRVCEVYPRFIRLFPTPIHLMRKDLHAVLTAWQGMGYNRRAKFLQEAAHSISALHNSHVPSTPKELETLPGIGPYSARAIACFAYGNCEPFIETNIRRAIIHDFFPNTPAVSDAEVMRVLIDVEPKRNLREWYLALMDYGREACKNVPNPNRRSKHYTKQSPFEGSPRQLRAAILRVILQKKKILEKDLALVLQEEQIPSVTPQSLRTALQALQKERLIKNIGAYYTIHA